MAKKRGQLDREIETFLTKDPKERLAALLMQRTDEAREIARDLLLEQGIIKSGRVTSVRTIGDSFSGPLFQLGVSTHSGTRLGENDPKRYWMVETYKGPGVPAVGTVVDFTITDEYPPTGKTAFAPKAQLHPVGLLRRGTNFPESLIRKWIEKWWIE